MSADVSSFPIVSNGDTKNHVKSEGDRSKSEKSASSSSSKHKHKDKDRDREREKDRHRDKDKDREKDKHRDKDKNKNKDKERSHSKDRDRSKHKDKSRDKDRDRHRDKDRKDRDKDKERRKEKDRDREKRDKDKERDRKKESSSGSGMIIQSETIKSELVKHEPADYGDSGSNGLSSDIKVESSSAEMKSEDEVMEADGYSVDDAESGNHEEEDEDEDVKPARGSSSRSSKPKSLKEEDDDEDMEEDDDEEEEDDYEPDESDEDEPKKKKSVGGGGGIKRKKGESDEDEDEDFKPGPKKRSTSTPSKKPGPKSKTTGKPSSGGKRKSRDSGVKMEEDASPRKRKKAEDEEEVWKWWEEEKREDGVKWTFLEHQGPSFPPLYERLPDKVKFYYAGKEMRLSSEAEEVATFYARMLDHDYTSKDAFNTNFFKDWRSVMSEKEKSIITDLSKCDFKSMAAYFLEQTEIRKSRTKEEKKVLKEENEAITKVYGFCTIDKHKEKIGNFKIEPPGLFRGRGDHPKMGKLKKRVQPEEVIINCSKDSKFPTPPTGHRWKEVRHDNTVTWLASWTENVQGQNKYVMLNPSSKLKGEKDWQKYETARKLHKIIDKIRADYWGDMKSKEMRIRQRAVALYFIDKLALRAGNEKETDEAADTVGCCSLRYEHIQLHAQRNGKENVVVFDFLGKDSIRYYNEVPVEARVFKNLKLFMENKHDGDDLFDRLNTSILNKHLQSIMDGLTAKVFRTYNASRTLQEQLDKMTVEGDSPVNLILTYNRANRAVAILCNHQRAVPKTHDKSMANLKEKIEAKRQVVKEAEKDLKKVKKDCQGERNANARAMVDKKQKAFDRLKEQLTKLELQATDKEEGKEIALGTSKLNYLDPRISVAWCKKHNVALEKVYSKTHRMKFRWAIDMAGPDFVF